jgi:hypothetical protein
MNAELEKREARIQRLKSALEKIAFGPPIGMPAYQVADWAAHIAKEAIAIDKLPRIDA